MLQVRVGKLDVTRANATCYMLQVRLGKLLSQRLQIKEKQEELNEDADVSHLTEEEAKAAKDAVADDRRAVHVRHGRVADDR